MRTSAELDDGMDCLGVRASPLAAWGLDAATAMVGKVSDKMVLRWVIILGSYIGSQR